MTRTYGTIIVGAGLAGATAALVLSHTESVCVLEADRAATGASGVAAGIANPFMSQRANPVWHHEASLEALERMLGEVSVPGVRRGILRVATDAAQAQAFRERARAFSGALRWNGPEALAEHHPEVRAPFGGLVVHDGLALDVARFVRALLAAAARRGAEVREGTRVVAWREMEDGCEVELETAEGAQQVTGRKLLLCPGAGFDAWHTLSDLALHRVKGQVVEVPCPDMLHALPVLTGAGYIVPQGDRLVLGSSYEHSFSDQAPSAAVTETLLSKAATLVPLVGTLPVLRARVGVRVTVPGTRLPCVGPVPGTDRVWVFTGLGSKGLLLAPVLARRLPAWFTDPPLIPTELRPRLRRDGPGERR